MRTAIEIILGIIFTGGYFYMIYKYIDEKNKEKRS